MAIMQPTKHTPDWLSIVQENILASDLKPVFADEVIIATSVKGRRPQQQESEEKRRGKGKKKKEEDLIKEGHVTLFFIDMGTRRPVAKIVLSPLTAEGFASTLSRNVETLNAELKSKETPAKSKEPMKTTTGEVGYN